MRMGWRIDTEKMARHDPNMKTIHVSVDFLGLPFDSAFRWARRAHYM